MVRVQVDQVGEIQPVTTTVLVIHKNCWNGKASSVTMTMVERKLEKSGLM